MTRFLLITALGLAACNKSDLADGIPAREVAGVARSPITGAHVGNIRAWHVRADGGVQPASADDLRTDEFGRYRFALDGETADPLVISAAFDDGTVASVLIAGSGNKLVAPPMTHETGAEAAIYQRIVGAGLEDRDGSASVLRAFVTPDVAAGWDELDDNQRDDTAIAIGEAVQAWEAAGGDRTEVALPALAEATRDADLRVGKTGVAPTDSEVEVALVAAWEHAGADVEDLSFMAASAERAHDAIDGDTPSDVAATVFLSGMRGRLAEDAVRRAAPGLAGDGSTRIMADPGMVAASIRPQGPDLGTVLADASDTQLYAIAAQCEYARNAAGEMTAVIDGAEPLRVGETTASAMNDYRANVHGQVVTNLLASGEFDEAQAQALATLITELFAQQPVESPSLR